MKQILQAQLAEYRCEIEGLEECLQNQGYFLKNPSNLLIVEENLASLNDQKLQQELSCYPISPRDITVVFHALFSKWASTKAVEKFADQATMAQEFKNFGNKDALFGQCFQISDTRPPLLYARN